MITVEAIRLAIEKVGLENLNGRAVRDAMATIKDFETGLIAPCTVIERPPVYNNWIRMYQVKQGKIVPKSDWRKSPWLPAWAKD